MREAGGDAVSSGSPETRMAFAEPWADCFFEYGTRDGGVAGVDANEKAKTEVPMSGIRNYRIEWDEPI